MVQNTAAAVSAYSLRAMADFRCKIVEMHLDGMLLRIDGQELWVGLLGRFNAYNLLAVYGAAALLGLDRGEVLRVLSMLHAVSGRFEKIRAANGTTGHRRLCPYARAAGERDSDHRGDPHSRPAADRGVRMRRRPRPDQASRDGRPLP